MPFRLILLLGLLGGCVPERADPVPGTPADTLAREPAPPTGALTELLADDGLALYAFAREMHGEQVVVIVNRSEEALGMRIPKPAPGIYDFEQATTDEPYRVQNDATGIIFEIGGRTTMVLRRVDG
jgi:hypothetical protein